MSSTSDHYGHRCRRLVQKKRSRRFNVGRGRWRLSTATCCRSARTSRAVSLRLQTNTRSAARTENRNSSMTRPCFITWHRWNQPTARDRNLLILKHDGVLATHRRTCRSNIQSHNPAFGLEQGKIGAIPRYQGRAVAPGRQGNQRVILKLTLLRDLPILRVADGAHKVAGCPPILGCWRPLNRGDPVQRRHVPACGRRARSAAKLRQNHGGVADDERSANLSQSIVDGRLAEPVVDVDVAIEQGPGHSRALERVRPEGAPGPDHEPPECC